MTLRWPVRDVVQGFWGVCVCVSPLTGAAGSWILFSSGMGSERAGEQGVVGGQGLDDELHVH